MLDKLGQNYTKTVYHLEGLKNPVKIEDEFEQQMFFANDCYVVDLHSNSHRYLLCWIGKKLIGEESAFMSEAMDVIVNHELTSD